MLCRTHSLSTMQRCTMSSLLPAFVSHLSMSALSRRPSSFSLLVSVPTQRTESSSRGLYRPRSSPPVADVVLDRYSEPVKLAGDINIRLHWRELAIRALLSFERWSNSTSMGRHTRRLTSSVLAPTCFHRMSTFLTSVDFDHRLLR